jgi:hypothetical protein
MGEALCDLVITNGVDVTTICRLGRDIPVALRTALDERDATCVVPHCDAVTGLEIDHRIVEVRDNGPTAMWNLAKLCSHHHHLRHHKGFTLAGGPGNWQWIPPRADPGPPDLAANLAEEHDQGSDPLSDRGTDQPLDDQKVFPKQE